jgi:two-component system OmpR family sensor kinase
MESRATHSLRARLLLLLFGAVVSTACLQTYVVYRTSLDETNEIFDYQMERIALSLRAGLPSTGLPNNRFRGSKDESFDFIVQVSTLNGRTLFQSVPGSALPRESSPGFSTFDARGTTYNLFSLFYEGQLIRVAQDRAARRELARKLAFKAVFPIFVMVPLLLLFVWLVVNGSLTPVNRVRKQVASRHADELEALGEDGLPDEIYPLVHELNLLFQRVRKAFEAQKNFIADAAHELRSPLSALKLQAEGLRRASDEATRTLAFNRLSAGVDRATQLVEQLLVLARHQAAPSDVDLAESIDLTELVQASLADTWGHATARKLDMGLTAADTCSVFGHREALKILVRNLLDNAIKYTPEGGTVNVAVVAIGGTTVLTVEDSGPGIPTVERARVFDRFYRAAAAQGSGSGLGLAIVKAITDMHAATIAVDAATALRGLKITVTFPEAMARKHQGLG